MKNSRGIFEIVSEIIRQLYQSSDKIQLSDVFAHLIVNEVTDQVFLVQQVIHKESERGNAISYFKDPKRTEEKLIDFNALEALADQGRYVNSEIENINSILGDSVQSHPPLQFLLILPFSVEGKKWILLLGKEERNGGFHKEEVVALQVLLSTLSSRKDLFMGRDATCTTANQSSDDLCPAKNGEDLLNGFPSPSFWVSLENKQVVYANKGFLEAYTLDGSQKKPIDELIHLPDKGLSFYDLIGQQDQVKNLEAKVWNEQHGRFRWCSLYAGKLDILGEKGVAVTVHDIQKRKDVEKRAIKLNQLLKAVNETQISFFVKDNFHNTLRKLLDAIVKITGSEYGFIGEVFKDENGDPYLKTHVVSEIAWSNEMLKRFGNKYHKGLDFRNLDTLFGECLKTGELVMANEVKKDPRSGGIPMGHIYMNRFLGIPVYKDGEMVGLMGFANRKEPYDMEDVNFLRPIIEGYGSFIKAIRYTRQKYKSDLLREESETMYEILSENTGDILMLCSPDLKVTYVSPSVEKVIGYQPDDIVGSMLWEFFDFEKDTFQEVGVEKVLKVKHKDGRRTVILEFTLKDMGYAGTMVGFLGAFRNVTERETALMSLRKNLNKERELSQLKSRFIRMTSHELRTPLTTLLSSAELLGVMIDGFENDQPIKHRMQNHTQKMSNQINRLIKVINDILILEKNTAGKDQINKETLLIKSYLKGLVDNLCRSDDNKIHIVLEFPNEDREVYSDPVWLDYIVRNILENAIKYSKNTEEDPVLSLHYEEDTFKIQVRDFGIGIPLEDQKYIFGSFFRAKNASNIRGAGLGLNIVKEFVDRLGGEISFTSCEKDGTLFTVDLPYGNALKLGEENKLRSLN
ncbi:GAF domain-containing protein [Echinicola sp. CAU 1574]|uniref:histidine kinase n=1 Tax=Echinicola arenosa TaxID=2774144 RepID=A0ABR9AQ40_9BACT|nr:ATP-binding protein [Echinicola arenosa]MBD8490905.1 GAF domain-containing protein [Echinicola arenosa]